MKIIGIEEKIGEFEHTPYHNVYFHTAIEFNGEKNKGYCTKVYKAKYDVLEKSFGKAFTTAEILNLVGKEVDLFYDEYKNVSKIEIITSSSEDKSK